MPTVPGAAPPPAERPSGPKSCATEPRKAASRKEGRGKGRAGECRLVASRRFSPSHQGVECPGKHQARCARCIHGETKPGRGGGRRPRCQGGGAGCRAASLGAGLPPPGNPEPSPRTGGAGAGRQSGGSRPGGGAGRAPRGGAVLCKCRPRAANCLRSARGSERPVPPAASTPEQLGNKPQRSREPRAQRKPGTPRGPAQPRAVSGPQPGSQASAAPSGRAQRSAP